MECMKVKIDVAEARVAELTAELLTMTEEAQSAKVLLTALSFQIEKKEFHDLCLIGTILFTCIFFLQYRLKQRLP